MTAVADVELTEAEMLVSLLGKLHAATKDIEAIGKGSENSFHHYRYAGIEDIVNGTRDHLLAHGLLVLAAREDMDERQRQTNQGEATVTTVHLTFRIYDVETGFSLELPWSGRGEDPADKGVSKALTDARKTFLIQQLNIARGDDTEADPTTDERSYNTGSSYGGGGAQTSDTGNLIAEAKGLSDEQLNHVLTVAGLPAAKSPFGSFARVPGPSVEAVRAALKEVRGG